MPKSGKRKHVDLSERVYNAILARQDVEKFVGTPTGFIENVLMQRTTGETADGLVAKHVAEFEKRVGAELVRQFDELKKFLVLELTRSGDRYVGSKYMGPEEKKKSA